MTYFLSCYRSKSRRNDNGQRSLAFNIFKYGWYYILKFHPHSLRSQAYIVVVLFNHSDSREYPNSSTFQNNEHSSRFQHFRTRLILHTKVASTLFREYSTFFKISAFLNMLILQINVSSTFFKISSLRSCQFPLNLI